MLTHVASLTPITFRPHSSATTAIPKMMSPGEVFRVQERPEQPADVVRHEERGDRDRDHVVEHLAPRREKRPELVEGVAGEARRLAEDPLQSV